MVRLTISLEQRDAEALQRLSRLELRDPRQQAAALIKQGLVRKGVLRVYGAPTGGGDGGDDSPPDGAA